MHGVPACVSVCKNLGLDLFLREFFAEHPQRLLEVNISSVVNYVKKKKKRKRVLWLELTLLPHMIFSQDSRD